MNGSHNLNTPRRAVLRAIITVGFQRAPYPWRFGWRPLLHRFGIALSAFSFLEGGKHGLYVSPDYQNLDMSEKGATTYWYGMAFAKLIAQSKLGIVWLAHVDGLRASGALTTTSGSSKRGDLAGRGLNNDWHVIEAKGRSNSYDQSLISEAKNQAAAVTQIKGVAPLTSSACITSLHANPISVLLDDPPPDDEAGPVSWEIEDNAFFDHYYRGVIDCLREFGTSRSRTQDGTEFVASPLLPFYWENFGPPIRPYYREWRLELGLLRRIYENPSSAVEAVRDLSTTKDKKVGSDGIALFGDMPEWEGAEG
ncbi:MAG: hypothetical protein RBT76_07705 [candidate division Zixibacteria bacterium]|nr:hypothetical protein [candidate division Zixibacteria bacterium]